MLSSVICVPGAYPSATRASVWCVPHVPSINYCIAELDIRKDCVLIGNPVPIIAGGWPIAISLSFQKVTQQFHEKDLQTQVSNLLSANLKKCHTILIHILSPCILLVAYQAIHEYGQVRCQTIRHSYPKFSICLPSFFCMMKIGGSINLYSSWNALLLLPALQLCCTTHVHV